MDPIRHAGRGWPRLIPRSDTPTPIATSTAAAAKRAVKSGPTHPETDSDVETFEAAHRALASAMSPALPAPTPINRPAMPWWMRPLPRRPHDRGDKQEQPKDARHEDSGARDQAEGDPQEQRHRSHLCPLIGSMRTLDPGGSRVNAFRSGTRQRQSPPRYEWSRQ